MAFSENVVMSGGTATLMGYSLGELACAPCMAGLGEAEEVMAGLGRLSNVEEEVINGLGANIFQKVAAQTAATPTQAAKGVFKMTSPLVIPPRLAQIQKRVGATSPVGKGLRTMWDYSELLKKVQKKIDADTQMAMRLLESASWEQQVEGVVRTAAAAKAMVVKEALQSYLNTKLEEVKAVKNGQAGKAAAVAVKAAVKLNGLETLAAAPVTIPLPEIPELDFRQSGNRMDNPASLAALNATLFSKFVSKAKTVAKTVLNPAELAKKVGGEVKLQAKNLLNKATGQAVARVNAAVNQGAPPPVVAASAELPQSPVLPQPEIDTTQWGKAGMVQVEAVASKFPLVPVLAGAAVLAFLVLKK